jgi:hypothetical protein
MRVLPHHPPQPDRLTIEKKPAIFDIYLPEAEPSFG